MARSVYSIDNLLTLVTVDHAREIRFCAGTAPILVREDEAHPMEGPALTPAEVETLFRCLASTRQSRELSKCGRVEFIYYFQGNSPFLVSAELGLKGLEFVLS